MPRSSGVSRGFLKLDIFREIPSDLTEPTFMGSVCTIAAVFLCCTLFVCEFTQFLTQKPVTSIVMDSNQDQLLRINFDISMHDLSCQHMVIGVWDSFGSERLNITSNILKTQLNHEGEEISDAQMYTEEELLELDKATFTDAEMAEFDRDWVNKETEKHDKMDIDNVIESHDYTFINFYAGWCHHCRAFAPAWDEFEKKVNENKELLLDAQDKPVNVRVLKINCVDFEETCAREHIQAFPTVRLFRRSITDKRKFANFEGPRNGDGLLAFAKREVKKLDLHGHNAHFHSLFKEGCKARGFVEVARVPGTLHFEAAHSKDVSLNFAYTNVSHTVNHLSFSSGNDEQGSLLGDILTGRSTPSAAAIKRGIPKSHHKNLATLDGRSFLTSGFHQAPHHYIQVVSTLFEDSNVRSYQLTHQHHLTGAPKRSIPQAKFSYSLSPVEVHVGTRDKKWYEFVTSVLAIVGGAFTFIGMMQGTLASAKRAFKSNIGKIV